jgi:hypothetical protein
LEGKMIAKESPCSIGEWQLDPFVKVHGLAIASNVC